MWFDQSKIEALASALKSGRKDGIENILHDVLTVGTNPDPNVPTFCPRCGKPFVQKPLLYLLMVVKTCPDGHGVWLSADNARKIKLYFEQHLPAPGGPRYKVKSFSVFAYMVGIAVAIFNFYHHSNSDRPSGTGFYPNYKKTYSMEHLQKVNPQYWPTRDFSQWNAFPANQIVITNPEELGYFQQWIALLNEGIVNRLNMNDALIAKRPSGEYTDVYYFYADRQNEVIRRMRDLYPPERLQAFHDYVVDAAVSQVAFYEDYARQKTDDASLQFNQLLDHPKLKDCDKKLWAAFHEFERVYPDRDAMTNSAIEQRLCWMDLI